MSSLIKCVLAIFAVVCFMQFVALAPSPSDEPTDGKVDFSKALDDIVTKLKGALGNEDVQKFISSASNAFNEGSEQLQKTFSNIGSQIGDAIKKQEEKH